MCFNAINLTPPFFRILKKTILLFLSLIFSQPFSISEEVSNSASAKVFYPTTSFDFGSVSQGEKLSHDFEVFNQGQADLVIRKVNVACGCTAAVAESAQIAPGGSTFVRVTFDTAGFIGEKVKTIRVYTNDPLNSSQLLEVRAKINSEFVADKKRVEFNEVEHGTSKEEVVSFAKNQNTDSLIIQAFSKSPYFLVSLDKSKQSVLVRTKKEAPLGKHRAVLTVKTNSKSQEVINIPMFLEVVGKVRFDPEIIQLGVVNLTKGDLVKTVVIKDSNTKHDLKITNLSSDIKNLTLEHIVNPNTGNIEIRVKFSPKAASIIKGVINISFDNDSLEYKIPVFGVVDE